MSSICPHCGSYLGILGRAEHQIQLSRCGLSTNFTMLCQRRLRWLEYLRLTKNGRIPKDILYRKLTAEKRHIGHPQLCYRDMCKRDMKQLSIDENKWIELATNHSKWKSFLQITLNLGEKI